MTSPDLAARTSVVTGSTSGTGAAIAEAFAAAGARVLVAGRDARRGAEVRDRIEAAGGHADFVAVDLAGPYAGLRAFADRATATLGGRVDILVNNAGIYPATVTEDLGDDDLEAMLAVNVRARAGCRSCREV
jgi:NAD(P)-dependent dehydrogenase (short-subunit alcohol dehydrogenase family)